MHTACMYLSFQGQAGTAVAWRLKLQAYPLILLAVTNDNSLLIQRLYQYRCLSPERGYQSPLYAKTWPPGNMMSA